MEDLFCQTIVILTDDVKIIERYPHYVVMYTPEL